MFWLLQSLLLWSEEHEKYESGNSFCNNTIIRCSPSAPISLSPRPPRRTRSPRHLGSRHTLHMTPTRWNGPGCRPDHGLPSRNYLCFLKMNSHYYLNTSAVSHALVQIEKITETVNNMRLSATSFDIVFEFSLLFWFIYTDGCKISPRTWRASCRWCTEPSRRRRGPPSVPSRPSPTLFLSSRTKSPYFWKSEGDKRCLEELKSRKMWWKCHNK